MPVTRALLEAYLASNRLLSGGKPGDETRGEEYVARLVQDTSRPASLRAVALRMLRPDHPALKTSRLRTYLADNDRDLRREAVRTLALRSDEASQEALRRLAANADAEPALRSLAVLGLAQSASTAVASRRVLLALLDEPRCAVMPCVPCGPMPHAARRKTRCGPGGRRRDMRRT